METNTINQFSTKKTERNKDMAKIQKNATKNKKMIFSVVKTEELCETYTNHLPVNCRNFNNSEKVC